MGFGGKTQPTYNTYVFGVNDSTTKSAWRRRRCDGAKTRTTAVRKIRLVATSTVRKEAYEMKSRVFRRFALFTRQTICLRFKHFREREFLKMNRRPETKSEYRYYYYYLSPDIGGRAGGHHVSAGETSKTFLERPDPGAQLAAVYRIQFSRLPAEPFIVTRRYGLNSGFRNFHGCF